MVSVAGGTSFTCAVRSTGTLWCWGAGGIGQLADGLAVKNAALPRDDGPPLAATSLPRQAVGVSDGVAVSAARDHACLVHRDGRVSCWGWGYIVDPRIDTPIRVPDSSTPAYIAGISGAVAVSTSPEHTCVLLADTTVRCWGNNQNGQLGDGNSGYFTGGTYVNAWTATPVQVSGLSGVVAISTGKRHTCALLQDGTVRCWGANSWGQLGNGSTTRSALPASVPGLAGLLVTGISVRGDTSCASIVDGTFRCWGDNFGGQFGNGTDDWDVLEPEVAYPADLLAEAAAGGSSGDPALTAFSAAALTGSRRRRPVIRWRAAHGLRRATG